MPRSFDLSASYPVSVDLVRAAFSDEGYWLARLADSAADSAALDSLVVERDGRVIVATTQALRPDRLPAMVTQFHHGDLLILRRESWSPVTDGMAHAEVSGSVHAAPVSLVGTGELAPTEAGSRLMCTATVEVNIPLVGGKLESFVGGKLAELMTAEQRFTTVWIAENV